MNVITREEIFLNAVANSTPPNIKPITREEIYLAKASGMDVETPEPITRREMYLNSLGGSGKKYENAEEVSF